MLDRNFRPSSPAPAGSGWVLDYRFSALIIGMVWLQMFYMSAAFPWLVPMLRPIKLGLIAASGLLILWRSGLSWLLLRNLNPGLIALFGLAWLSAVWSIDRGLTINRMIGFTSLLMTCFAFGLVSWQRDKLQKIALPMLTGVLLLSIAYYFLDRNLVVEEGDTLSLSGAWRGITYQKNSFGQIAAFAVILWFHRWLGRSHRTLPVLIGFGISFMCLILSKSSTSLLSTILALMFLLLLLRSPPNLQRWMPIIVTAFSLLVITYSTAVLKVVPGLEALLTPITLVTGKDTTFSDRSVIWEIVRGHIAFAPMLGTGYAAYWAGPEIPWSPSFVFYAKMYFYPGQSHNGYIEMINDLGYVGLCLLAVFLYYFVRQSLEVLRIDRYQGALYLSLFFMQAMTNLSQSIWFQHHSLEWVMMMFASVALARTLLEHKLRGVYGGGAEVPAGLQAGVSPLHWQNRIR